MLNSLALDNNKIFTNWISTGISSEKIKPFGTNLEPTMSNLANLTILFSVLVQKNSSLFSNFIFNLYIVYELNNWPRNPTNNFSIENRSFGTVKSVRNTIKSKFIYNRRGVAFVGEGSWCFGNDFAGNVVIFCVDNSSSSHTNH